jgi:hypothetical protein
LQDIDETARYDEEMKFSGVYRNNRQAELPNGGFQKGINLAQKKNVGYNNH